MIVLIDHTSVVRHRRGGGALKKGRTDIVRKDGVTTRIKCSALQKSPLILPHDVPRDEFELIDCTSTTIQDVFNRTAQNRQGKNYVFCKKIKCSRKYKKGIMQRGAGCIEGVLGSLSRVTRHGISLIAFGNRLNHCFIPKDSRHSIARSGSASAKQTQYLH